MPVTITAPNPDNYVVGKGRVYFQKEGAPGDIEDYRVGNVTEFESTPEVEKLEHFDDQQGTRSLDKSVVTSKRYTVRMIMEEWVPANMELMLMGTPDTSDPANVTIPIGSENTIRGHLRFVGTNDVGPKWTLDFPEVEFAPEGSLNPISDEWGGLEVTGEIIVQDDGSFGTASADFSESSAVPANTVPPTVYGTAALASTLTALKGTWTDNPTVYTYQWQRDPGSGFVDIAGATASTYLVAAPVVAGDALRVRVTATNVFGSSAPVASPPTADVP